MADKKTSREVEAHSRAVEAEVLKATTELHGRGALVEQELNMNGAVIGTAANNEMLAAEHMMERAGNSRVAQIIAADRLNRLRQADERTLNRGGF